MDQTLRDRSGRLLGRIKDKGNVLELRGANGRLLGRYYIKENRTRDAAGRLVGQGNLLSYLIKEG